MVARIRLAELLAAVSLTTDLGSGVAFEKGLRTCVVATGFAGALDVDLATARAVYQTALLRAIGCTASAPETAELFTDDRAFQAAAKATDISDPARVAEAFGAWDPAHQGQMLHTLADPTVMVPLAQTGCEVSSALASQVGTAPGVIEALDEVYERWDGLGLPFGRSGDDLTPAIRIVHIAEQAVMTQAEHGTVAALAEVARRAGGQLDPDLCAAFAVHGEALLSLLETHDVLTAVLDAEPPPAATLGADEVERLCLAMATFTDLKARDLIGHSPHVAQLATGAGTLLGLGDDAVGQLRAAALLHDLGRTAVSSEVWGRPGPLGTADLERVRLHSYWTERILARCPSLAPVAPIAAAHHERLDGSGYHRGARAPELSQEARVLAAADAFAAMTERRAYRPAMDREAAARELLAEASRGALDASAVSAVIEAAGLPRPRKQWPADLTDREVDVLRACAQGLTNREIADELTVSARTVQHHLASIYDKTGRRTRAGAAVFAVEHGLVH